MHYSFLPLVCYLLTMAVHVEKGMLKNVLTLVDCLKLDLLLCYVENVLIAIKLVERAGFRHFEALLHPSLHLLHFLLFLLIKGILTLFNQLSKWVIVIVLVLFLVGEIVEHVVFIV